MESENSTAIPNASTSTATATSSSNLILGGVPPQVVDEATQKIRNKREQALLDSIISIGGILPLDIESQKGKNNKKRFSVNVQYTLKGEMKDGKPRVHTKKVKFGKLGDSELEFIHHQNEYKKQVFLKRVNKEVSPLSPKWWRIYILNNLPSIQNSYNDACQRLQKDYKLYSSTTIYGENY
jgi:hypothetical protein